MYIYVLHIFYNLSDRKGALSKKCRAINDVIVFSNIRLVRKGNKKKQPVRMQFQSAASCYLIHLYPVRNVSRDSLAQKKAVQTMPALNSCR